jgi:hypothetical protein
MINTELMQMLMLNGCTQKRMIEQKPQFDDLVEPQVQIEVPPLGDLMGFLDHLPYRHSVLTQRICETSLHLSKAMRLCWAQVDPTSSVSKIDDTPNLPSKQLSATAKT